MADEPTFRTAIVKTDPDPTEATRELLNDRMRALTDYLNARLNSIEASALAFREDLTRVPTTLDRSLTVERAYNLSLLGNARQHADANYELSSQKFLAADQARQLLVDGVNNRIASVSDVVAVFKETVNERFEQGAQQADKAARDVKSAVDAAFAAAKEAVSEQNKSNALSITKSETATIESIKSLQALFQTAMSALTNQINDVKSRLDKGEGSANVSDPATASALVRMSETINHLSIGANRNEGAAKANGDNTTWIFAALGVAVAVGVGLIDIFVTHGVGK